MELRSVSYKPKLRILSFNSRLMPFGSVSYHFILVFEIVITFILF